VTRAATALALLALALVLARDARAQTPAERLARGAAAYQNLEYDSAATILRAALAQRGPRALGDSERIRALTYLGASELFRSRRDSAAAAFLRVLRIDPRSRPDELIFPPEVTSLFQEVRLTTRIVSVAVPPLTQIAAAGDRLIVWLYSTSYHQVDVNVLRGNGVPLRTVYQGPVGDSLQLLWDGLDSAGTAAETGAYILRVDSRGGEGRVVRSVLVSLDIEQTRGDTLPLPPPPADLLLRPEHTSAGSGVRALAAGFLAAATAAAMPSLIGGRSDGMAGRFVVSGALGAAAIVAFRAQRRPQPIPENIAANRALHLAWQRQSDTAHAENEVRRQRIRLIVRAGTPRIQETP
jgi:hypothetical protein